MSKAVGNVLNNVFGDLDPESGAVDGFVDFGQSEVHSVLEVFKGLPFLFGQGVHDVPLVGEGEF